MGGGRGGGGMLDAGGRGVVLVLGWLLGVVVGVVGVGGLTMTMGRDSG